MKLEMYNKSGLKLKTKDTYVLEDIEVIPAFPIGDSNADVQLFPPLISIVDNVYAFITDDRNGDFATSWRLYANGRLQEYDLNKGESIDLTAIFTENGEYSLEAKAFGEVLSPSDYSPPIYYQRVVYTEGLAYGVIYSDGAYKNACTGIGTAEGTYIAIAPTYNSVAVVAIDSDAFAGNETITGLYVPDSVRLIKNGAFEGCTALDTITLSNGLTNVEADAFAGCTAIRRVNYRGSIDEWSAISFNSYNANPLYYANSLYIGGQEITNAVLSSDATTIGVYAFAGFRGETITIPASVTTMKMNAFSYCYARIVWGENQVIDTIPQSSFRYYKGGGTITTPNTVRSIGNNAFFNSNIQEFIMSGNGIALTIFSSIGQEAFKNCTSLTSVTIAGAIVSIQASAFEKCTSLTNLNLHTTIADNVGSTTIYTNAFKNCTSLTVFNAPNYVDGIQDGAFENCTSLTTVTFGVQLTEMSNNVFEGCTALTVVDCRNLTAVPTIGTDVFLNTNSSLKIVVPDALYDTWVATENWAIYVNNIIKASEYTD